MEHMPTLRSTISTPDHSTPPNALILKGLTYQVGDAFRNSRHFDYQLQGNDYPIVPWVALSNLSTQYENLYWAALLAPLHNIRPGKYGGSTYKPVWDGDLVTGVSVRISSSLFLIGGHGTRRNSKLIKYGLISTRGKGSTYEVTFLAKHPALAEAVLAGFEYVSARAHENWPERLSECYVLAAADADGRECRRLLDEAEERTRLHGEAARDAGLI